MVIWYIWKIKENLVIERTTLDFHSSENEPEDNDKLKRYSKGREITNLHLRKNILGIKSRPKAEF